MFLEINNIVKQYGQHTALDHVSINVQQANIFGLLGPNGAGKTTLLRIINRITAPDSGTISFDGQPLHTIDTRRIGYLPEERGLYKKSKTGEQAIYFAQLKGLDKYEARRRLTYWFDKFELSPWWNKKLDELSKGMQQKLQFIITVVHQPDLLIFDEPFSGFDPVNANLLKNEIQALKNQGHTIIFSTHNMASVEEICDQIALINHAQVVLAGDVAGVKQQFKTNVCSITLASTDQALAPQPDLFTVIDEVSYAGIREIRLRKTTGVSNAQLLQILAQQCDLQSFTEELPSIQDIFIQTVTKPN
jgi:ABC-2 type transport system ATP-binding protein